MGFNLSQNLYIETDKVNRIYPEARCNSSWPDAVTIKH